MKECHDEGALSQAQVLVGWSGRLSRLKCLGRKKASRFFGRNFGQTGEMQAACVISGTNSQNNLLNACHLGTDEQTAFAFNVHCQAFSIHTGAAWIKNARCAVSFETFYFPH